MMNERGLGMGSPEPINQLEAEESRIEAARKKYNIYNKPLIEHEHGVFYTTDFDGTAITAEAWNEKMQKTQFADKFDRTEIN